MDIFVETFRIRLIVPSRRSRYFFKRFVDDLMEYLIRLNLWDSDASLKSTFYSMKVLKLAIDILSTYVRTTYARVIKFEAKRSHLLFAEIFFMENKHMKCGLVRCTSVGNKYIFDIIIENHNFSINFKCRRNSKTQEYIVFIISLIRYQYVYDLTILIFLRMIKIIFLR